MTERLCPDCQKSGKCLFREYARKIAQELDFKDFNKPDILMAAALEVHQKIAQERIEARKRMCPNLNDINPDYQGKELL